MNASFQVRKNQYFKHAMALKKTKVLKTVLIINYYCLLLG